MERIKPGYTKFRMLSGREAYVNMTTMKECTASEALLGGAVRESSRTEFNESNRGNGSGSKSDKKRLREAYRGLGLSKTEAKLAEKHGRGR